MDDRLSTIDQIFLRTHQGLGTPIVMQGLWRTEEAVEQVLLMHLHDALRSGWLGRRVVRSPVPGARPYWQLNDAAYPMTYSQREIPPERVLAWADSQGANLNPLRGPGWRLSATRIQGGGTVVSLTCSHVLTDARGLLRAVEKALAGDTSPIRTEHVTDWTDARTTMATIARETRFSARRPKAAAREGKVPTIAPARSAILAVDANQWDDVAKSQDASANSLFVALSVNLLQAARPVTVSLPVDARRGDEPTNSITMTGTTVRAGENLADLKARITQGYSHPDGAAPGLPEQWLQLFPARLAYAATRDVGDRDVMCSNIGQVPSALEHFGPHPASGFAARAIHPGLTRRHLRHTRNALSAYLCRFGDGYTLALVATAARITSNAQLRDLATAELRKWGLRAETW
ncbi:hypothetical protein FOS14_10400 [Skermania sp. ID1734]|uniref:hypothetical protein n=1 Tax=Skermania sp. ID1734 TaxID=2597516 RepID=UPI00117E2E82|nr:hypothetical protein [Skermania sp. ID1734]TSD99678.1 hypothetical protein FOS14_10400 [Skermania sp. ID1734]